MTSTKPSWRAGINQLLTYLVSKMENTLPTLSPLSASESSPGVPTIPTHTVSASTRSLTESDLVTSILSAKAAEEVPRDLNSGLKEQALNKESAARSCEDCQDCRAAVRATLAAAVAQALIEKSGVAAYQIAARSGRVSEVVNELETIVYRY